MVELPKFQLYGKNNPEVENKIQPHLVLREWNDLSASEKRIALQELLNNGFVHSSSNPVLQTISNLNHEYLRQCPGKILHSRGNSGGIQQRNAAFEDFKQIFVGEKTEAIVLRMISEFCNCHIDSYNYAKAENETDETEKRRLIYLAFEKFDKLASCLNHIFEQFSVNVVVTRSGIVPKQDSEIINRIYNPTLVILSDPKWKSVSDDLSQVFINFQEQKYPETITVAHRVVQRFLQILVGEEGKNGKGEVGKLFSDAKKQGLIPTNRFTEPIIEVFQGYISSERATNSSAKPSIKEATSSDALLVLNVVMIFLQHCLQHEFVK